MYILKVILNKKIHPGLRYKLGFFITTYQYTVLIETGGHSRLKYSRACTVKPSSWKRIRSGTVDKPTGSFHVKRLSGNDPNAISRVRLLFRSAAGRALNK
jgi:hypothetical protein